MKRSIIIKTEHGDVELELAKVVSIDTPKKMISIEEMPSGKGYRLAFSKNLIEDISKVQSFDILRED